jgi:hypothetical protein
MLFILGATIVLVAAAIVRRARVRNGLNAGTIGWMSEQWLAEHQATHSA